MSDKVKLPREVAEALDDLKDHFTRWEWHVTAAIFDEHAIGRPSAKVVREYAEFHNNIKIVLQAIVNGYEVEQTPEDKVREYYEDIDRMSNCGGGARLAIRDVLNLLNIKIQGVNAE